MSIDSIIKNIGKKALPFLAASMLVFNPSKSDKLEAWPWENKNAAEVHSKIRNTPKGYKIDFKQSTEFKRAKKNRFLESRFDLKRNLDMNYEIFFKDILGSNKRGTYVISSNRINITDTLNPKDNIPDCFIVPIERNKLDILVDEDFKKIVDESGSFYLIYMKEIFSPSKFKEAELSKVGKGIYTISNYKDWCFDNNPEKSIKNILEFVILFDKILFKGHSSSGPYISLMYLVDEKRLEVKGYGNMDKFFIEDTN